MKTRRIALKLSLLAAAVAPAVTFASPRGEGPMAILNEMNLTKEQKDQLKNAKSDVASPREMFGEMKEQRDALDKLLRDPKASEADIKAQADKGLALMKEAQSRRIEWLLKLRKVLTPEQFGTFLAKMDEGRKERWGGRKGPDGGKGEN